MARGPTRRAAGFNMRPMPATLGHRINTVLIWAGLASNSLLRLHAAFLGLKKRFGRLIVGRATRSHDPLPLEQAEMAMVTWLNGAPDAAISADHRGPAVISTRPGDGPANICDMERHFDHELSELKQRLLTMASHAERAVNQALQALVTRDHDLALQVRDDDGILDRFEIEIDELAVKLLAKTRPADDLRLITGAMKISQNLERVGDEAAKIAKRTRDLCQEPPLKVNVDLPRMARLALDMLKAALDAFVNRDPATARNVIPRDLEVDALNKAISRELVRHMTAHTATIPRCLHLMTVSKCLERIADHATNVAEEVVYLCEAQDIRHTGKGQSAPPAIRDA